MPTKKLFPGVTEKDIQEKEQEKIKKAEAAKKKAEEFEKATAKKVEEERKKTEEREFNDMVKDFYEKFGNQMNAYKTEMQSFVVSHLSVLGIMYAIWGVGHVPTSSHRDAAGEKEGINLAVAALSETDFEVAEKTYKKTGSKTLAWGSHLLNPVKETYDFSTIFKKESYDTFGPGNWKLLRAYLGLTMVIAFALLGLDIISDEKKKKIEEIKRTLKMWNEQDFGGLEANTFPNKNHYSTTPFVNPDMVAKIISHLSSKDAKVFNDMMNGTTEVPFNTAVKIMEGHLKAHPEDLQMVLDSFDERSIPNEIKNMAKAQKNR